MERSPQVWSKCNIMDCISDGHQRLCFCIFPCGLGKKVIKNSNHIVLLRNIYKRVTHTHTAPQDYLPCVFIILIDLYFPTIGYVTVVTPHCKHRRVGARAGWWGEQRHDYTDSSTGLSVKKFSGRNLAFKSLSLIEHWFASMFENAQE